MVLGVGRCAGTKMHETEDTMDRSLAAKLLNGSHLRPRASMRRKTSKSGPMVSRHKRLFLLNKLTVKFMMCGMSSAVSAGLASNLQ